MAVTIADVAKQARVSKSTVSQYLNGRYEFMSEETREKVKIAIEDLHYIPNQVARSLKQKRTNVIALVAATLTSRFTTEIVSEVERYFTKKQVDVIVASTEDDPQKEKKVIEKMIARQVDGVLVFPNVANRDFYNKLIKSGFPVVFIDRYIENVATQMIVLDNVKAGQMATEALIQKGHKNIGIVTFPLGENEGISNRRDRVNGYLIALQKNGLTLNRELILQTTGDKTQKDLQRFYQEKNVSALVFTNDILLEQMLIWAKEASVKLPDDLSVVSIDDVSFAHFFTPGITTIAQPVEAIAKKAAKILDRKILGERQQKSELFTFEPRMNERDSIKKIEKDLPK